MKDIRVHPLAPVAAIDIDNTLGDYTEHLRWFAELYKQEPVKLDWSRAPDGELSEAMGMDKEEYRQIKLAYRQGGMKRSIPPMDSHVGSLVRNLREQGMQVWICTTRPWQRLDNIDPDTQFWINRVLGKVDGVIYGEEKYLDLIDIVGRDRIVGVADDLPENFDAARAAGLRAILRAGYHNFWWRDAHPNALVAYDSNDILHQMEEWRQA